MTPLLLLGLSLTAAAESLNATLTFASPAESGRGSVQVEITSPEVAASLGTTPTPARFRAVVGRGDARIDSVRHVGSSGEKIHTVLAFDRSGSFSAYWDDAFDLAEAMADALPAGGSHTVEVMSFHGNQTFHGAASTPADLRTLLAEVEAMGTLGSVSETSLMSAVKDSARRAAEQQPTTGGRQVILFSDAGEEGAIFTLDETIAAVRAQGTVIHPVVLKQVAAPGSNKARVFSKANDRMKKLAEASGGQHIHVQDAAEAKRLMMQHATVSQRLYWLELSYCAVPQGEIRFKDTVQIEVLQGSTIPAKTASAGFRQHAAGSALLACADLPAADPAAATAATDPGQDAPGTATDPGTEHTTGRSWLWPTLLGALLLMMMLGGAILLVLFAGRKKKKPEPVEATPAPTPAPDPVPVITPRADSPLSQGSSSAVASQSEDALSDNPLALPTPAHNPLEKPPVETRLRIISGPSGLEPYYRVSGSTFTIGGVPTADLCIDIKQISSHHATIKLFKLGTVYITDHSLNGTYLDGRRLKKGERTQVSPGQRISISQQLVVELWQPDSDPAAPPAPPAPPPQQPEPPKRSRQKTVYGPLTGAPPPPVSSTPDPPKRSKSKTIIQPLRKDDEP